MMCFVCSRLGYECRSCRIKRLSEGGESDSPIYAYVDGKAVTWEDIRIKRPIPEVK